MKKYLILFLIFIISGTNFRAQFSNEHWIAPYISTGGTYVHGLYFSTDATTPFSVEIYSNGVLVHTVNNLSKNNPQSWILTESQAEQYIYSTNVSNAFTVSGRGLYTKSVGTGSDKRYYVNMRMYNSAHGEFLTSKGDAALGTEFYAAHPPIMTTGTLYSFTTGILATEDNTSVTVSGYNAGVIFAPNTTPSGSSVSFNLNKGQSVVLLGLTANSGSAVGTGTNQTGFIGAKIVATKPITVTNGNANGNFGTSSATGSDLILDQSVPVSKLGNTFAMVRSLTPLSSTDNLEGGLVVAVEDNTQIFVNGNPTALATINKGQYYRILSNQYVNQGSGHYNMYISTTKPVYLYQLLAIDLSYTGGWNYIPPLSCYLPRKIDEIGNVNQMPNYNGNITMKLNIITEAGANITVNGVTPNASQGPFPVNGNANWVTYDLENVSGNLTIISNKAMTAGINGGYSTAGYGGYFAGFSSTPVILNNNQVCIPGIVLSVENIFETYQWFFNGSPISGANTHQYTPTQPGNYSITVSISGCNPISTPIYKVYPCPVNSTQNHTICGAKTFPISFSQSTQTLDNNSITITTPPANGTATVNNLMGTITYIPNPGFSGTDSFSYYMNSTVTEFFESENVTVNLNVVNLVTTDDEITACPYNGVALYDLTTTSLTSYPGATITYFPTLTDAQNGTNVITNYPAYVSAAGSVFAKIVTPEGCTGYSKIDLLHYEQPNVTDDTLTACFREIAPTTGEFDLTKANIGAINGIPVDYFPSLIDAENNTNEIQNPFSYISNSTNVYARVYNENGCYRIAKITLVVSQPNYSPTLLDKTICLEDRTTLDAGPGFDSYLWNTGQTTQTINNVTVGEYEVILTKNGCPTKQKVRVYKAPEVIINNVEINNSTATLYVSGGTEPYQYSLDGITWQSSNVFTDLPRGENQFFVKDSFDCNPTTIQLTIANLVNAITPNNDGVNDFLDYSILRYKSNLRFGVYDRYGNKIFEGNEKNSWRWDGRTNGKKVTTGTYWYEISWNEKNAQKTPVKYNGWVVVKNK